MKKIYLLLLAVIAYGGSYAQAIPNGDMEIWRSNTAGTTKPKTVQAPQQWYGADSLFIGLGESIGSIAGFPDSVWNVQLFDETTIVNGGSHSAKIMTTFQDTILFPGVMSNAKTNVKITLSPPGIGGVSFSGGAVVNVKPTTVSAYVQYIAGIDTNTHMPALDSGFMTVQAIHTFGTVDSVIGIGTVNIGPGTSWTQVTANVIYAVDTTDSVNLLRITFTSSGGGGTIPTDSSVLYVDDVSMTSIPNPPPPIDHTGVRMLAAGETLSVFPNPATDKLYINTNLSETLTCKLISVTGQVVQSVPIRHSDAIDVSRLPGGVYLYHISDSGGDILQQGKVTINK